MMPDQKHFKIVLHNIGLKALKIGQENTIAFAAEEITPDKLHNLKKTERKGKFGRYDFLYYMPPQSHPVDLCGVLG